MSETSAFQNSNKCAGYVNIIRGVDVNLGYLPAFEFQGIEDKGDTLIIRDYLGILQEVLKNGSSIPRYIDYPIKTRNDWKKIREERLNPHDPCRFPENWDELEKLYNDGDAVVQLGTFPYGLFGTLRDMMGVEELLVSFYEQPAKSHCSDLHTLKMQSNQGEPVLLQA